MANTSIKCAFLGLGVMGFPMAGHLLVAGHEVTAWNRSAKKREDWLKAYPKGRIADTAADAVQDADMVMMCLGDDPDVEEVFLSIKDALKAGQIIIDHTTASADLARKLAADLKVSGISFMDAPVSGGQAGAENGALTIMCGGDEVTFNKAEPVLDAYAKQIVLIGDVGAGQLAKSVNQIAIAGLLQGLSEAMMFGEAHELDLGKVFEAISKGAAGSWQMENRWGTMAKDEFEFGFAVDWMRKDLRIAMAAAKKAGVKLELTPEIDRFYSEVQSLGGGRYDTSSLVRRLRVKG